MGGPVNPSGKAIKAVPVAGLSADEQTATLSDWCAKGFHLVQVDEGIAYLTDYEDSKH